MSIFLKYQACVEFFPYMDRKDAQFLTASYLILNHECFKDLRRS